MRQRRRQAQNRRLIESNAGTEGNRGYERLAVTWLNRVRRPEQERDQSRASAMRLSMSRPKAGRAALGRSNVGGRSGADGLLAARADPDESVGAPSHRHGPGELGGSVIDDNLFGPPLFLVAQGPHRPDGDLSHVAGQ